MSTAAIRWIFVGTAIAVIAFGWLFPVMAGNSGPTAVTGGASAPAPAPPASQGGAGQGQAPAQSPPPSSPNSVAPGATPAQPALTPNQTPDLYPSQTPPQSPERSAVQSPAQSLDQYPLAISSAGVLSNPSTGQVPSVPSSTVPGAGQQFFRSSGTVAPGGTPTVPMTPGLPQEPTSLKKSRRDDLHRTPREEFRQSPVNRAIEEKSPEGVEDISTFEKDMQDRIHRLEQRDSQLQMQAQDFPPDRQQQVGLKIDRLRRERNEVRSLLQEAVNPGTPKGHERSLTEEAMDRLENSYRETSRRLQRSFPAGERENTDFSFEQRDSFSRTVNAELDDLQKRLEQLSVRVQQVSGDEKKRLQQQVVELDKRKTALQQRLSRAASSSRGHWDRAKQEIEQGLADLENALRSTESQTKEGTGNEGKYNQG